MTRSPSQLPGSPFFSDDPNGLYQALDQLMIGQPTIWNALASGSALQAGIPTPDLACRRQIIAFTHPFTAGESDFKSAQSAAYQPTTMSKGQGIIVFETGFNVETLSGHLKAKRATLPVKPGGQPTYQDLWTLEEKITRTDANALNRRVLIARYTAGQIASDDQRWPDESKDSYRALNLPMNPSAAQLTQLRSLMGQSTNEVRRGVTLPSRLPASQYPQAAESQLLEPIALAKPLVLSPADNSGYSQTSWGGASYQAFLNEKSTRTPQLIVPTDGDFLHVIDLLNQGEDARENYAFLPKFRQNDNWLKNIGDRVYRTGSQPIAETGLAIVGQPLVVPIGAGHFVVYGAGSNYRDDSGVFVMIGLYDKGSSFSVSNPPILKGIAGLDVCALLNNCSAYQVKTTDASGQKIATIAIPVKTTDKQRYTKRTRQLYR